MSPNRTILYYPTISIPTNSWLRQSLLYFDEIASIVPQSFRGTNLKGLSDDIYYLLSEGIFRPIYPDLIQQTSWRKAALFQEEFVRTFNSIEFQGLLSSHDWEVTSRIHRDKMAQEIYDLLHEHGLANIDDFNSDWIFFESTTSLLYMAILAKHLAAADSQGNTFTIPGTDSLEFENLLFQGMESTTESINCLNTLFYNLIPYPKEDIPLSDIVEFKRKRRNELLHFREVLDTFQSNLKKCETQADIQQVAVRFGEDIEKGVNDLVRVLNEARLLGVLGALKTLIQPNSVALWATVITAGGSAASLNPSEILHYAIPAIGVAAAIEVGHYVIDEKKKLRATTTNSPFSYVLSTQFERLTLPLNNDQAPAPNVKLRKRQRWG